jgi:hypothetical protein
MARQRALVALTFVAMLAAFIALAALAAGGKFLFGTLTAGERQVFVGATIVAMFAAVVLLLERGSADVALGPVGGAVTGFVIALAFSPLAVLAFTTPVSTPADDSSGCGTISSPNTIFDQVQRETVITPTCADRLRKQKFLAGALIAPSVLTVGLSLAIGMRGSRRVDTTDDVEVGQHR